MINEVKELPRKTDTFTRDFMVTTQTSYGLSTVLGFVKYHLSTSKVKLVHEKMFTSDEKYIYSIYNEEGSSIGRVLCYTEENRFDISYDLSSLFSSNLSISNV